MATLMMGSQAHAIPYSDQPFPRLLSPDATASQAGFTDPLPAHMLGAPMVTNEDSHAANTSEGERKNAAAVSNLLAQLHTSPETSRRDTAPVPQPSISPINSPFPTYEFDSITAPADASTQSIGGAGLRQVSAEDAGMLAEYYQSAHRENGNGPADLDLLSLLPNPALSALGPFNDAHALGGTEYSSLVKEEIPPHIQMSTLDEAKVEAFAKLEFPDGHYYITTHSCELGRDQLALLDAKKRLTEEQEMGDSNHMNVLQVESAREAHGSQIKGSVVSERAGFCGLDLETGQEEQQNPEELPEKQSSQASESSVVNPADLELRPPPLPSFDYHSQAQKQAEFQALDDQIPAPVTVDHLPTPHSNPLIPIHASGILGVPGSLEAEIKMHTSISRRHVRIFWHDEQNSWMLRIMGTNGAFVNDKHQKKGTNLPLRNGTTFQVSSVSVTFKLPNLAGPDVSDDSEADMEEETFSPTAERSTTTTSDDAERTASPAKSGKRRAKDDISPVPKRVMTEPQPRALGPDGKPKRGPGRPPKGEYSMRELKEREKKAKAEALKRQNGGKTPPPGTKLKQTKVPGKPEPSVEETKPGKRKYTKKKRPEEDVVPSIEGGENMSPDLAEVSTVKKPKKLSKSLSPAYPAKESLDIKQLEKPPQNYTVLLHEILMAVYPRQFALKNIYRALKMKHPYFVYTTNGEGWQSSVRHNLNGNIGTIFFKADEKNRKGDIWSANPDWRPPTDDRKKQTPNVGPGPKPRNNAPANCRQPPQQAHPPTWNTTQQGYLPPNNMPPYQWPQGPNGGLSSPQTGASWPQQPQMHSYGNAPPLSTNESFAPQTTNGQPQGAYPGPHGASTLQPPSQSSQQGILQLQPVQNSGVQNRNPPSRTDSSQAPPPRQQQQQQYRPQVSSTQLPASPRPPFVPPQPSASAAPNMPCTFQGIEAIQSFERKCLEDENPERQAHIRAAIQSARRRALHGATQSSIPGPETVEEREIVFHLRDIIQRFHNPAFRGFTTTAPEASEMQRSTQQGNVSADVKQGSQPATPQTAEAALPSQPQDE